MTERIKNLCVVNPKELDAYKPNMSTRKINALRCHKTHDWIFVKCERHTTELRLILQCEVCNEIKKVSINRFEKFKR